MISRWSSTFSLEQEMVLAYGVAVAVLDSIVVGVNEIDFGVKGGVDLLLFFNLVLLLFPAILAGVLLIFYTLLLEFLQLSCFSSRYSFTKERFAAIPTIPATL